jgi:hypothetical protein
VLSGEGHWIRSSLAERGYTSDRKKHLPADEMEPFLV